MSTSMSLPHQHQLPKTTTTQVAAAMNNQFKQSQMRPSIIQAAPVDCSKFTGGLNFAQIRQLNSQQVPTSVPRPVQSVQMVQQMPQPRYQVHNNHSNMANDLNNIEPTLPFTNHLLTSPEQHQQQLQQLQHLQQQQQQVNHNMNVQ